MDLIIPITIVGIIGLICGIGLSIVSEIMAVPTDEKIAKLREVLPGANCGACGYSGCDAYAEALSKGDCEPGLCAPGGDKANNALGKILGVKVNFGSKQTAVVLCAGTCEHTTDKMDYRGISTCSAANMMYNGVSACSFGCLGFGDCQKACKFSAVSVKDNKASINSIACTACGACVKACPKGIIKLVPENWNTLVMCSNHDKGIESRKVCDVGCIGCRKCEKVCEFDAIKVDNNLAVIDQEKCTGCGKCALNCPVHCIISTSV